MKPEDTLLNLALGLIVVLLFLVLVSLSKAWHLQGQEAALMVGVVAVIGWLVQARTALINSRKQHTINVLLQSRFSSVMKEHVDRFIDTFGLERKIQIEDLTDEQKKGALRSVSQIANFYEFLAVSLEQHDLDEALLRDTIRSQVIDFNDRAQVYLDEQRKRDKKQPSRIYVALPALAERWRKWQPPRKRR